MHHPFFLVTENTLHVSYLVARWLAEFDGQPNFLGIALREEALTPQHRSARAEFHRRLAGQRDLTAADWSELCRLYPDISETERAMVAAFGIPELASDGLSSTVFLGRRLNSEYAKEWLFSQCSGPIKPYFLVFLDRILAPWWMDATECRIVNAHSAVLPHARGTFAIEQVAIGQRSDLFVHAAGATVHYVDNGVDTGPIIRAERFRNAFAFNSIWDCKAHSFMLAYDLLIQIAREISDRARSQPAGTLPAPSPYGAPEFKRRDFTEDQRAAAEFGYLAMRDATRTVTTWTTVDAH